jgi:hypothetical protein
MLFGKRLDRSWRVCMGMSLGLAGLMVLAASPGCRRSSEGPIGKVFGAVTFEGRPVTEGMVCFNSGENGVFINAPLHQDGTYVVIRAKGHGVPLGKYLVAVIPPPPNGPLEPGTAPQVYPNIPQKYRDPKTSGLRLAVGEEDNQFDIQMSR